MQNTAEKTITPNKNIPNLVKVGYLTLLLINALLWLFSGNLQKGIFYVDRDFYPYNSLFFSGYELNFFPPFQYDISEFLVWLFLPAILIYLRYFIKWNNNATKLVAKRTIYSVVIIGAIVLTFIMGKYGWNTFKANQYYNKGIELKKAGKLDEAIEAMRKSLSYDEENYSANFEMGEVLADKYEENRKLAEKLQLDVFGEIRIDDILHYYTKAISGGPTNLRALRQLMNYHFQVREHYFTDHYDLALDCADRILEVQPKNDTIYKARGIVYLYMYYEIGSDQNRLDKAIANFYQAMKINKQEPDYYMWIGKGFYNKQNYNLAIEYFGIGDSLSNKNMDDISYYLWGCCYGAIGNREKEQKCYIKAAKLGNKYALDWLKEHNYKFN